MSRHVTTWQGQCGNVTGPGGGKKWWQLLVDIGWKTRSLTKWMRKRCQLMLCCNMCCQNWNKNLIVHNIGSFLTFNAFRNDSFVLRLRQLLSCNGCWTFHILLMLSALASTIEMSVVHADKTAAAGSICHFKMMSHLYILVLSGF